MLKKFCQCLGLSSLVLVTKYVDLLGGGDNIRLHTPFPLRSIVFAEIADILVLGAAIFIVLVAFQRTQFYKWVKLLIVIVIPPYLIGRPQGLSLFTLRGVPLLLLMAPWAAFVLLVVARWPRWYRRLLRAGDMAGVFAAAFALLSIVQLLWIAHWKPATQQRTATWTTSPQPPRDHPRLIWIVFDELSYDQVFEHRDQALSLPNFDALRNQSTVFTNVQPVAYKTVKAIPSLLIGQPVDDVRYRFDNTFLVHYTNQRGWHKVTGAQTVFRDAQQNGWRTAVVGWYNPYCGIYGDAVDQCYWMARETLVGIMDQEYTFWRNVSTPFSHGIRKIEGATYDMHDTCDDNVRYHRDVNIDLRQHAMQLLQTDQADFVFLHLPVPHAANIWDRSKHQYIDTCGRSYLDNLALADLTLGNLMQILEASSRWKDTTLIVEGDHGWRVDWWSSQPAWTAEDQAASRGVFDPRPALLVHQAGQTQPQTNATAWPLVHIHDVVEQVVKGQPVSF